MIAHTLGTAHGDADLTLLSVSHPLTPFSQQSTRRSYDDHNLTGDDRGHSPARGQTQHLEPETTICLSKITYCLQISHHKASHLQYGEFPNYGKQC